MIANRSAEFMEFDRISWIFEDFSIFFQLWTARSPWLLNRFQKVLAVLICTLSELSIALCFVVVRKKLVFHFSRWKIEILRFWLCHPQQVCHRWEAARSICMFWLEKARKQRCSLLVRSPKLPNGIQKARVFWKVWVFLFLFFAFTCRVQHTFGMHEHVMPAYYNNRFLNKVPVSLRLENDGKCENEKLPPSHIKDCLMNLLFSKFEENRFESKKCTTYWISRAQVDTCSQGGSNGI